MKKYLFLACLFASTAWAIGPRDVIRAYNQADGGYVVLDADNEVVAFSGTGIVDDDLETLQAIAEADGRILIIQAGAPGAVNEEVNPYNAPQLGDSVGPLLKDIAYDQGAPYNCMAPLDYKNGNRQCVTGCVATAMAQIMAYWKYPVKCNASIVEYQAAHLERTLKINYDTMTFDWGNILDAYPNGGFSATEEQKLAVGRLMWACGVAAHMNFTSQSSGTQSNFVSEAFIRQFDYSSESQFVAATDYVGDQFLNLLIEEFDAGRPVYASGQYTGTEDGFDGGHAFVIDGYGYKEGDVNHTKPYFHFNWGWSGYNQKGRKELWYRLSGGKDMAPYISGLQVIVGLQPRVTTAVEEAVAEEKGDNRIFDILGREVNETVPGQLYIRNGRKFIAR